MGWAVTVPIGAKMRSLTTQRRRGLTRVLSGITVLAMVLTGLTSCGGEAEDTTPQAVDADNSDTQSDPASTDESEPEAGSGEIATGPGITDDKILIGEITAATGPAAVFGDAITNGQRAFFESVNAEGGIAGRQYELVVRDSAYDVQKAVEAYTEIASQVAVMGQIIGTPSTNALLSNIKADKLLTAPTSAALSLAREPEMILVGTPYAVDMANIAAYGINELGLGDATWGVITPDDDFGADHVIGAKQAAMTYGFELAAEVTFRPSDQDFTAQVQRLKDANVDVVLVGAIGGATPRLLGAAKQLNYSPTWLASNPTWVSAFTGVPEANSLFVESDFYMASPFAVWGEDVPGMDEMLANLQEYTPDQNPEIYFMMGYTQAKVIHAIFVKAAENGDMTRDGLLKAFGQVGTVPQGGLLPDLNYGVTADERIPTRANRIFDFDPDVEGFLVPLTDFFTSEAAEAVTTGD